MRTILTFAAIVIAFPGAVTALHLTVLSIASIFYREPRPVDTTSLRYLIVVPARNEKDVIANTLSSLLTAMREGDILLVVADRCTDDTAAISRRLGANVLERHEEEAPGRAAAIVAGIAHAATWDWEAVSTIDADSLVNRDFFGALDSAFASGAKIAQPRSEHIREHGILARMAEAAFAMQGVTLPRGRTRLGIGVRLRGSGMTMLREIVEAYPFTTGGVSEDMFYSLQLVLDDVEGVHVDSARLRSLSAPTLAAGGAQRVRWEIGRLAAARSYIPKLIRHASPTSLEVALLLGSPPFAVAAFLLLVGAGMAALAGSWNVMAGLLLLTGLLALDIVIGLTQTRAPWQTWLSLLSAPFYIVWKAVLHLKAIANVKSADQAYEPTERK